MKTNNRMTKLFTTASAAALLAGGSLVAGDYGKAVIDDKMPIEADPWTFCDVFDMNTLYEGDGFVQEVSLHGRYHGQWVSQREDYGATTNDFHEFFHRRFRLGAAIEFQGGWSIYAEANISDGIQLTNQSFFNDFQDLYIKWEPNDTSYLKIGKQKQHFTREDTESSKRILTVERAHITNETSQARPWGVTYGFEAAGLNHEIGAWVLGQDGQQFGGWPRFDSRGSLSYNVNKQITDATTLFFDYVYNNNSDGTVDVRGNAPDDYGSKYEHSFALGTESEWGNFGLVTDFIVGINREDQNGTAPGTTIDNIPAGNDTWGVVILPYYNITDQLQFVAKYAYMDEGRDQHTQRFNVRQTLQNYHTFYAGLNYYICSHKLKLMGGYEYATGEEFGTGTDIDSGTWMLAVRGYF